MIWKTRWPPCVWSEGEIGASEQRLWYLSSILRSESTPLGVTGFDVCEESHEGYREVSVSIVLGTRQSPRLTCFQVRFNTRSAPPPTRARPRSQHAHTFSSFKGCSTNTEIVRRACNNDDGVTATNVTSFLLPPTLPLLPNRHTQGTKPGFFLSHSP